MGIRAPGVSDTHGGNDEAGRSSQLSEKTLILMRLLPIIGHQGIKDCLLSRVFKLFKNFDLYLTAPYSWVLCRNKQRS